MWRIMMVVLVLALSSCATVVYLNEPARSRMANDVAAFSGSGEIPYETQERSGLGVSYSLTYMRDSLFSGYRLTLVLRNMRDMPVVLTPDVQLRDSSGLVIAPYPYDAFVSYYAAIAGSPAPLVPTEVGTRYYHSGTITSPTGHTYRYSGHLTPGPAGGFAGGFARGMGQGMALAAAMDRSDARRMMQWASHFWLRERYVVPAASAVSGILMFPAAEIARLPLTLTVGLGSERFEFVTVSAVNN